MSRKKRNLLTAVAAIAIVVLLAATAYAASYIFLKVEDNYFQTGQIDVSIITDTSTTKYKRTLFGENVLIEPGATLRGDFTIQNNSNDPSGIWYRFFLQDVTGDLAEVLEVTLYDADGNEVKSGRMTSWENRLYMSPKAMANGDSHQYTLELHHPESAGNETQNLSMSFKLAVVAVQRKNNDKIEGLPE